MIRNLFRPWVGPPFGKMPTVRRSREAAYAARLCSIVLVGIEALIRTG